MRLRYFSSQPLIEDDSERQPESTIVNALVGYRFGRYEVSLGVLNLFDSQADDIAYYYTSRLPDARSRRRSGPGARARRPASTTSTFIPSSRSRCAAA